MCVVQLTAAGPLMSNMQGEGGMHVYVFGEPLPLREFKTIEQMQLVVIGIRCLK